MGKILIKKYNFFLYFWLDLLVVSYQSLSRRSLTLLESRESRVVFLSGILSIILSDTYAGHNYPSLSVAKSSTFKRPTLTGRFYPLGLHHSHELAAMAKALSLNTGPISKFAGRISYLDPTIFGS